MKCVENVETKCWPYYKTIVEGDITFMYFFLIIREEYDFCPGRTSEYSSTGSQQYCPAFYFN